ncbi:hypothetical protein ACFZCY_44025 [Streptomyces sp. NPDC007983]|uniref:hypothetical protein n=1 Tax=Streptomyces sp. NPDC007983 TaxID=3364800 RepID=UPI0036E51BC9
MSALQDSVRAAKESRGEAEVHQMRPKKKADAKKTASKKLGGKKTPAKKATRKRPAS